MPYLGPCPPRGNAPQHYVFTLIATSLEPGALQPGLDEAAVLEALKGGKTLGAASLVLRFTSTAGAAAEGYRDCSGRGTKRQPESRASKCNQHVSLTH